MDEDHNMAYGIDRLAELLAERDAEFYVNAGKSLFFMDGVGNPHECSMAGAEENLVNVMIAVTPEQAISVPDLNGVISENAQLKAKVNAQWSHIKKLQAELSHCIEKSSRDYDRDLDRRRRLATENAKLRELVKAFDWCTENFDLLCKCDSCPLGQSDKLTPECEVRMRELGIETANESES